MALRFIEYFHFGIIRQGGAELTEMLITYKVENVFEANWLDITLILI